MKQFPLNSDDYLDIAMSYTASPSYCSSFVVDFERISGTRCYDSFILKSYVLYDFAGTALSGNNYYRVFIRYYGDEKPYLCFRDSDNPLLVNSFDGFFSCFLFEHLLKDKMKHNKLVYRSFIKDCLELMSRNNVTSLYFRFKY